MHAHFTGPRHGPRFMPARRLAGCAINWLLASNTANLLGGGHRRLGSRHCPQCGRVRLHLGAKVFGWQAQSTTWCHDPYHCPAWPPSSAEGRAAPSSAPLPASRHAARLTSAGSSVTAAVPLPPLIEAGRRGAGDPPTLVRSPVIKSCWALAAFLLGFSPLASGLAQALPTDGIVRIQRAGLKPMVLLYVCSTCRITLSGLVLIRFRLGRNALLAVNNSNPVGASTDVPSPTGRSRRRGGPVGRPGCRRRLWLHFHALAALAVNSLFTCLSAPGVPRRRRTSTTLLFAPAQKPAFGKPRCRSLGRHHGLSQVPIAWRRPRCHVTAYQNARV